MKIETKDLITSKGAATYLGVSTQRIYAMITEGKIEPTEIGGIKFFTTKQLDKFKK